MTQVSVQPKTSPTADPRSARPSRPSKAKTSGKPVQVEATTKAKDTETHRMTARFIRVAPRKLALVSDQVRGQRVVDALMNLRFSSRAAAQTLSKLLHSALANAEHNLNWEKDDVMLLGVLVNGGPTLKRYQPRAHGRSNVIRKRTSHVTLTIGLRPGAKAGVRTTQPQKTEDAKLVSPDEIRKQAPKKGGTDQGGKSGGNDSGFLKKVFQRKTG